MAFLAALWLPILLSAVFVFVASSIMHMVLPYHRNDYRQIPDEDKVLAALRGAGLTRGLYVFRSAPQGHEVAGPGREAKTGTVGFMTIMPSGPPAMPKFLIRGSAIAS